ncbi:hypothetical protein [Streptomyces shenzhenensis]|uniref:hypothetical protein n=1 Tax=Streptomyces shenzhenensis TaxID=943815 RepID=UPI0027E4FCD0|nr:hypothetical protein [Streptomyces shenzhenensis]
MRQHRPVTASPATESLQGRLAGEALADYVSSFGGGCFLALPGVRDASDRLGRGLPA